MAEDKVNQAAVDVVVERLKAAAPQAKDAGVNLGIENTLSAEQNAAIPERISHEALQVYHDVGNSATRSCAVPAEIRSPGKRICMVHFKDGRDYPGEGKIRFDPIAAARKAIRCEGWIVLEAAHFSRDAVADTRRNAALIRTLFGISARPARVGGVEP